MDLKLILVICLVSSTFIQVMNASNSCNLNPCMNGGSCFVSSDNTTSCMCPMGTTGIYCEQKNLCTPNSCMNGGSCFVSSDNTTSCMCLTGFTGTYCEMSSTCSLLNCKNGATCYYDPNGYRTILLSGIYYYTNEMCRCTSGYTGLECDIKNSWSNFIWTPDEQCRFKFGSMASAQFQMYYNYFNTMCTYLQCTSSANGNFYQSMVPSNGTLCAAGAICINQQCVNITNAPKVFRFDQMIGNMTCDEYLTSNWNSATSLCNIELFRGMCPISCEKYRRIKCNDTLPECPALGNMCNLKYQDTNKLVSTLCPYTCNSKTCKDIPLQCSKTNNICLNGATCINVTPVSTTSRFAFQCVCTKGYTGELCEKRDKCNPNPCKSGKKCVRVGSLNNICI